MVVWSELIQGFFDRQNAVLSAVLLVFKTCFISARSSFTIHPFSRAFTGNPLFPLILEPTGSYFKGSRD